MLRNNADAHISSLGDLWFVYSSTWRRKNGKQIQTTTGNPSQFPRNIPDIRFGDSETSESGNLEKDQLCYIHLDV